MLDLDSPRWNDLWHMYTGYGDHPDAAPPAPELLRRIEAATGDEEFAVALRDFMEAIYHQGDFCPASYGVTPHLARLCENAATWRRSQFCYAIALIELARLDCLRRSTIDFEVADDIVASYHATLQMLPRWVAASVEEEWDRDTAICFTAALLVAKGHPELGKVIPEYLGRLLTGVKCRDCGAGTYVPGGLSAPERVEIELFCWYCQARLTRPLPEGGS